MNNRTRRLNLDRENELQRNFSNIINGVVNQGYMNEQHEYKQTTPEETVEEENDFKNAVHQLTKFEDIKLLDDDVLWGGYIERFQIKFNMSAASPNGLTISANVIELNEEVMDVLKKLLDYYEGWSNKWNQQISV